MAQLDKRPTLDFGSGHDLVTPEWEPRPGICADSDAPTGDSVSLCPSPAHARSLSLSLSEINKKIALTKQSHYYKKTKHITNILPDLLPEQVDETPTPSLETFFAVT